MEMQNHLAIADLDKSMTMTLSMMGKVIFDSGFGHRTAEANL